MGQRHANMQDASESPDHGQPPQQPVAQQQQQQQHSHEKAEHISNLIDYARNHYQENPTESLACLMQALTLNSGKDSADAAMQRLREELGDGIADHIGSYNLRMERAVQLVQLLVADESTFLYQRGVQDLLRQTMEDGTSVVCTKCNAVVNSTRWEQHLQYWCQAIPEDENMDDS